MSHASATVQIPSWSDDLKALPVLPPYEVQPPLRFRDAEVVQQARATMADAAAEQRGEGAAPSAHAATTVPEALALAEHLHEERYYQYGRLLIQHIRTASWPSRPTPRQDWKLARLEVLCTYKDPELAPEAALPRAMEILCARGFDPDDARNGDPEMLALAGAIEKRWWEVDGRSVHLERAFAYYSRACDTVSVRAAAYQRANAAFVLDLLAFAGAGGVPGGQPPASVAETPDSQYAGMGGAVDEAALPEVGRRRAEADRMRQQLLREIEPDLEAQWNAWAEEGRELEPGDYWDAATLAETNFALARWDAAATWFDRALRAKPRDWQIESTCRQLGQLARVRRYTPAAVGWWSAARAGDRLDGGEGWTAFLQTHPHVRCAMHGAMLGKVGLALSGGGFRASLYHIGVLARLAELDLLRHVEVMSCVSGGSIVGAKLYLELRRLLEALPDGEITREHYVDVVARIATDLRTGIEHDLRTSLLADRAANARAASDPDYSRTHRLGELFEERLFGAQHADSDKRIWFSHLYVEPKATASPDRPFSPRRDNWCRAAKVPFLILNATSLNTGHAWQFTASWMGEPPTGIDPLLDAVPRLRRIRFSDTRAVRMRLGEAVAASACVPATFEPLVLRNLYPGGIDLALADGGVYDNQGSASLLEQQCAVLVVSDASGQLKLESRQRNDPFSVAMRANEILMARVRESQYAGLHRLEQAGVLSQVVTVHLRLGLSATAIRPVVAAAPASGEGGQNAPPAQTPYGIRPETQRLLAELRTDLDAFHEVEASALMESGYRMMFHQCAAAFPFLSGDAAPTYRWPFRRVSCTLVAPAAASVQAAANPAVGAAALDTLLRAGAARFGKSGHAARAAVWGIGLVVGVLASLVAVAGVWHLVGISGLPLARLLVVTIVVFVLVACLLRATRRAWKESPKSAWDRISGNVVRALVSPFAAWHLRRGRVTYLARGSIPRTDGIAARPRSSAQNADTTVPTPPPE